MTSTLDDYQRESVTDFLQGKESAESSGEIMGMLKAMLEEMEGDLATAKKDEASSVTGFEELSAAKSAEISSATSAIESKTKRSGEVAVEVVQTKDDLEDTEAEVKETQSFIGDLATQCAEKKGDWAERQKMRAEEVSAISEAIKVLNDDDALDLFKKTIPSLVQTGMQFLQKSTKTSVAQRAKGLLVSLMQTGRAHTTQLSLMASALASKAVDFSKITEQIDGMIDVLGKEQTDDDTQKAFCDEEFTKSAATKKETEDKIASLAASIEEMSATVATMKSEIETLTAEIAALDKAVAEATEQRKEEHAMFLQAQAEGSAAVQLIEAAKNKLNKFYNPTMYKAAPKTENTMEEKIIEAGTFVQVRSHSDDEFGVAPPPPPETFGAYEKKGEKSAGVIGLMDMMVKELETDMKDGEYEEKTSQSDYGKLMSESEAIRSAKTKSITSKEVTKAETETKLGGLKESKTATDKDLDLINGVIQDLHVSCDFLLQNFDLRKEARTNEVESLKNAKAILSGANFR